MTAALPDPDPVPVTPGHTPTPLQMVPPLPSAPRSDGLIRVRMVPLVPGDPSGDGDDIGRDSGDGGGPTTTLVDQQLIIDYTSALARRAATHIRDGQVEMLEHPHAHPRSVACLRCAVLGASEYRTLATTLLEILDDTGATEHWNCDPAMCTDVKSISRLRRLAISAATMANLYGPSWGTVMLTCLRIEQSDFELIDYLTRHYQPSRVLRVHTRDSMAAHHLAMACCPTTSRDGSFLTAVRRNTAAVRMAVAVASVPAGPIPAWFDYLPVPSL